MLRHVYSLKAAVSAQLQRPLRSKDSIVFQLMLVGAYQLKHAQVKDHAAINETVSVCRRLGRPWATRLVNAVLRKLQRLDEIPDRSFDHPDWLRAELTAQYPLHESLMTANNTRAPMTLRVNLARISRAQYQRKLETADLAYGTCSNHPGDEACLVLDRPLRSESLPGWASGEVAVQDRGAQLAAGSLWPRIERLNRESSATIRLLDACSAPGGKLFHLMELCAAHSVTLSAMGVDLSPGRQAVTREIGIRLGHRPELETGDATGTGWWNGTPFDVILLDAPCSGTGTLRRHPDIKVLLSPAQVAAHTQNQARLLRNLWSLLTPGGTLLYCTCSVLEQENDLIVAAFVDEAPSALQPIVIPIDLPTGQRTRHGWQLLPTDPTTDGFYFSLLRKPLAAETEAP